jgi:hypothetical protein
VTTAAKASPALQQYLEQMRTLTAEGPLNIFSKTFQFLQQKMLPVTRSPKAAPSATVPGMVRVPAAMSGFDYDVRPQAIHKSTIALSLLRLIACDYRSLQ